MDNTIFSVMDAKSATRADFCSGDSRAVDRNYLQVFYACNIWFGSLRDIGVPMGLIVPIADVVKHIGLRPVCTACFDIAESMLGELGRVSFTGEHLFRRYLTSYIQSPIADVLDFIQEAVAQTTEESTKLCLQFLLFLERFTYSGGADEEASIRKYLDVNSACRDLEYDWGLQPGETLIGFVRDALAEMLTVEDWFPDDTENDFSTGSVLEAMSIKPADPANKSTLSKWGYLSRYVANAYGVQYPLPGGRWGSRDMRMPRMTLVPKSFTSRRVIFPEDSYMSFTAHGLLVALRRMLTRNGTMSFINERDQSVNRELARVGSQTGEWATIDMSSASDSIGKALVFRCIPRWFVNVALQVSSWNIEYPVDGRLVRKKLFSFLTSGNPMTWLFESVWFLALGRVAAALAGDPHPELSTFSYGDDMVVRSCNYETTLQVLESFGHRVNVRKSYGEGRFRESCGGWFFDGQDVTPTFWPRRTVEPRETEVAAALVDLQHKCYTNGWFSTAAWVTECVEALYPKMTKSSIGSSYGDLWDPDCDEYYDSTYRHSSFISEVKRHGADKRHLAEYVAYAQYLLQGPLYVSDEDKAWGISTSRFEALMRYPTDSVVLRKC